MEKWATDAVRVTWIKETKEGTCSSRVGRETRCLFIPSLILIYRIPPNHTHILIAHNKSTELMATPPDTRPSTPGTPMASTIRDVFDFDERIFAAAGEMDKQTTPASNNKQELFVFQWLASVERELKRCGHVSFARSIAIQTLKYDHGISFFSCPGSQNLTPTGQTVVFLCVVCGNRSQ